MVLKLRRGEFSRELKSMDYACTLRAHFSRCAHRCAVYESINIINQEKLSNNNFVKSTIFLTILAIMKIKNLKHYFKQYIISKYSIS